MTAVDDLARTAKRQGDRERSTVNLALSLAACGWGVVPCKADKKPINKRGSRGATTDPAVIRRLFQPPAAVLVGYATDHASGVTVLDLDPNKPGSEAVDWFDEHYREIPETFAYNTRSGGSHFVFRYAEGIRNSESRIARNVDVRAEGGYCIAWFLHGLPLISSAPPALMPAWLIEAALAKPATASPSMQRRIRRRQSDDPAFADRGIDGLLAEIASAPDGQRASLLFWGACRMGERIKAWQIHSGAATDLLLAAARRAGWTDDNEALGHIARGIEKGLS